MLLCVDVGNSNIVLGGYTGETACFLSRIATDRLMEADQYAVLLRGVLSLYGATQKISRVVMASVVPTLTPVLLEAFSHFVAAPPRVLCIADANAGDVVIDIDNPAELGTDILASALAVRHTRPLPAVIIDMGTATKFTALDSRGHLLGVAIAPGLYVSLEALVQRASGLRGIPLDGPAAAIGKNTPESMKSGVLLGNAAMLDGMIDRFAAEMGGLGTVVATGGAAAAVVPHCGHNIEISETLLLDGLRILAETNADMGRTV